MYTCKKYKMNLQYPYTCSTPYIRVKHICINTYMYKYIYARARVYVFAECIPLVIDTY